MMAAGGEVVNTGTCKNIILQQLRQRNKRQSDGFATLIHTRRSKFRLNRE